MLTLAVAVTAVGCGGGSDTTSTTTKAPEQAAAPAAAPSGPTGDVAGVVSYANGDPDSVIAMDADPVCLSLHSTPVETEKVVATDGNLANAFVYVKSGLSGSFPAPSGSKVLDQNGCQYKPHVSGVQVGQTLVIRNSDETLHNVHALPSKNAEFNNGQPFKGMELEHTFDKAEVMVPLKCDVHPWMSSYIGVLDHPFYAVTGTDGSFTIPGLPPGTYTIEAIHESLGTKEASVTVGASESGEVSFNFTS
jgi:plastocyanin